MNAFSAEEVKRQLERITASPEFVAGRKLGRFLTYVVGQTLNGNSHNITQYAIAVEGLGYAKAFDPTTVPNIRVLARRLRRALELYYINHGTADPIRIDIPKGSYVPVFRENQTVSEAPGLSECPPCGPAQTTHDFSDPAIAVVMFENLNESDENLFLARGITAELLSSFTRFSGLSVLGPLVQDKASPIDYSQIHHEHGARFILQGGIRSYGLKIRITTDLTDASTGKIQWGRTFDYDLEKTSLFEIENDVTSQVTGVVADSLGIIFRKLRTESYHEYIKLNDVTLAVLAYNNAWTTQAPQDWERANIAVDKVLSGHSDNALLVALQSNIYYADVLHDMNIVPDSLSKMEGLAYKAVSLDPDLQIAQYNLVTQNAFLGRTKKCVEQAQKVVDMNPNHARVLAGCAVATTSVGAYDVGWEYIERAKLLNPHYPGWYHFINYLVYYGNEQYEEAWTEAQKIHVEGLLWHPIIRASILGKLGRNKKAKVYIDELLKIKPKFPKHPKEYIKLLFVTEKHVEMIWDGLYKAGMRELG